VSTVQTTDGNGNSTGTVTTTYSLNQTTVSDQAGKARLNTNDALGRLTIVTEDPSGPNYTGLNYSTFYVYDALSNLTGVNQPGQQLNNGRAFAYDSLSRLVTATNPQEQIGSTTYSYDADSNLYTRTDPNNITTVYTYDHLNRIMDRKYVDGPTPDSPPDPNTPEVTYTYDGNGISPTPPFSAGRLTTMSSSVSESEYTSYDQLGRVTGYAQVTAGVTYPMSYSYNLAGQMLTEKYPSGRMVTDQYDTAGRVSNVGSGATNYRGTFAYAPFGGIMSVALGNKLTESTSYNSRLQPMEIKLGPSGSLFDLLFTYQNSSIADNGNVLEEKLTVASTIQGQPNNVWDQNYTYDGVNRISTAMETFNLAGSWSRAFGYDNAGNMWVSSGNGVGISPATPQGQRAYSQLTLTNRLADATYDSAGNLTTDLVSNTYLYDAENKQRSCTITNESTGSSTTGTYTYDGDGHRITKAVTAVVNGQPMTTTTTFVYNAGGALVAEYGGPALTDSGTSYLTTDHLASTRVVTDGGGNVRARHDFLPFGEEIGGVYLNITSRSNVAGYVASDDTRQRFTSKERDSESENDYFGARYYSSVLGRFDSTDPLQMSATVYDPQSWNKYSYCLNNPLSSIDQFGLYTFASGATDEDKRKFRKALDNIKHARNAFHRGSVEYNELDRALSTYGQENVNNGVRIAFGATKDGAPAATDPPGVHADPQGMKVTTGDNPTGRDITVTIDPSKLNGDNSFALAVGHEGSHVADETTLVAALPSDLSSEAAQQVVGGPLNLTQYDTETRAYTTESFLAQGLGVGAESVGPRGNQYEIWNSGWAQSDRAVKRTAGIDRVLALPKSQGGLYEITPASKGRKFL
jgi:RHS repeat-associated protein